MIRRGGSNAAGVALAARLAIACWALVGASAVALADGTAALQHEAGRAWDHASTTKQFARGEIPWDEVDSTPGSPPIMISAELGNIGVRGAPVIAVGVWPSEEAPATVWFLSGRTWPLRAWSRPPQHRLVGVPVSPAFLRQTIRLVRGVRASAIHPQDSDEVYGFIAEVPRMRASMWSGGDEELAVETDLVNALASPSRMRDRWTYHAIALRIIALYERATELQAMPAADVEWSLRAPGADALIDAIALGVAADAALALRRAISSASGSGAIQLDSGPGSDGELAIVSRKARAQRALVSLEFRLPSDVPGLQELLETTDVTTARAGVRYRAHGRLAALSQSAHAETLLRMVRSSLLHATEALSVARDEGYRHETFADAMQHISDPDVRMTYAEWARDEGASELARAIAGRVWRSRHVECASSWLGRENPRLRAVKLLPAYGASKSSWARWCREELEKEVDPDVAWLLYAGGRSDELLLRAIDGALDRPDVVGPRILTVWDALRSPTSTQWATAERLTRVRRVIERVLRDPRLSDDVLTRWRLRRALGGVTHRLE